MTSVLCRRVPALAPGEVLVEGGADGFDDLGVLGIAGAPALDLGVGEVHPAVFQGVDPAGGGVLVAEADVAFGASPA